MSPSQAKQPTHPGSVSNFTIDVVVSALTRNQFSADELRDILKRLTPSDRSRLFVELDRVMNAS